MSDCLVKKYAYLLSWYLLLCQQNKNEKSNHPQYTSNLAILKASPVVFQGFGDSMDQSREDAADKALQAMASKEGENFLSSLLFSH